jgi:predicted GIY-YIG superfamily endonuclease
MYFVYIIKSMIKSWHYVGLTEKLQTRMTQHHRGDSNVTKPYRPLMLTWYCIFRDKGTAAKFEKYLKSGSGRAFTKRHNLNV